MCRTEACGRGPKGSSARDADPHSEAHARRELAMNSRTQCYKELYQPFLLGNASANRALESNNANARSVDVQSRSRRTPNRNCSENSPCACASEITSRTLASNTTVHKTTRLPNRSAATVLLTHSCGVRRAMPVKTATVNATPTTLSVTVSIRNLEACPMPFRRTRAELRRR